MWSDNETTQDLLGYQVHADLLKKIILDKSMLPISIGVFGNWGSGKSSLMLLLYEGIAAWNKEHTTNPLNNERRKNGRILQVQFNSWQFESYDTTKLVMIETILTAIKNDISENMDIFEKADDFLSRINVMQLGVFLLKKAYVNFVPDDIKELLPSKEELDKITGQDTYNELLNEIQKGNTSKFIGQFRTIFEQMVKDADYQAIVVYVDDLDRCDPKRIIGCLEAVKLFVNVDKTAFVIGADERIIEYAIKQHYPIEQKKEEISSPFSDYLEKLIQLPYKIPRLSGNEQETYITLLLCKQCCREMDFKSIHNHYVEFRQKDKHSKYNIDDIKKTSPNINLSSVEYMLPIVPIMRSFLNGNPRQLKRFMNTLYVRKELASVAGFDELRPDVLVKLMVLEYNSLYITRFDELYRMQRDNSGVIPISAVEEQAKANEDISDSQWKDNWNSDYLKRWLSFQPSLSNVNLQNYFWVARDALRTETPISTMITRKIALFFRELCAIQTATSMSKRLPVALKSLEEEERDMFVILLNERLVSNPDSNECWRILNDSASDSLFDDKLDRLKALFNNVNIKEIAPQAANFFVRITGKQDENTEYISKFEISRELENAINRKKNKMGTSQSHNLKSGPNWKTAKRSITSIAKGTGNTNANCQSFAKGFSSAIGNNVYRGGSRGGRSTFGYAGSRVSRNFISLIGYIRTNGLPDFLDVADVLGEYAQQKSFKEKILEYILGEHDSSMDDAAAGIAMEAVLDEIFKDCASKEEMMQKIVSASNDDIIVWMIDFHVEYILEFSGELFQSHIFDKCDNPNKVRIHIKNWLHQELDMRLQEKLSRYDFFSPEGKQVLESLTAEILDIWKQE